MQVSADQLQAPSWEVLIDACETVSKASVEILKSLPAAQSKMEKLTKHDCLAVVHQLEIETGHELEDIDEEARLKLLFELQEVVQTIVQKLVSVLDVHDMLTEHVDRILAPVCSRTPSVQSSHGSVKDNA